MATKSGFTPEEWQVIEFAIMDTMAYMSMVDPGFWASFKEAGAVAKFIASQRESSPSALVRDLASDVHAKRDSALTESPTNMEAPVLDRIADALALVDEKAPDDLQAFRNLIMGVARSAAEASGGVSEREQGAIDKIAATLGE